MKKFTLESLPDFISVLLLTLEKEITTDDLFRKTYSGSKGPASIRQALENLDDAFGRELDTAIEHCAMDTGHPERIIRLELSVQCRLLLRFRIENAIANIPQMLWNGRPKEDGRSSKYSLSVEASSLWESICFCLTGFWKVSRAQFFYTRAQMLSHALKHGHR